MGEKHDAVKPTDSTTNNNQLTDRTQMTDPVIAAQQRCSKGEKTNEAAFVTECRAVLRARRRIASRLSPEDLTQVQREFSAVREVSGCPANVDEVHRG